MPRASLDVDRLKSRLRTIYHDRADEALKHVQDVLAEIDVVPLDESGQQWSEKDVVLITYGDQVRSAERNPLQTLLHFLQQRQLDCINTVHFLPCFPYTSDDGFSVVDYLQIDPNLGTWGDVEAFAERGSLMLDFVVNHVSQESAWFRSYLRGEEPYDQYFIEVDPAQDVSAVTRPRSLPLLSEFETSRGVRHLWTTFSRDQLDINYAEPVVLADVLRILLEYVRRGARIIRLDAIAYLWKRLGTNCIHLKETHEVVKLFRDVMSSVAPNVLVLTETNVPHEENISYFGDGDEAHMVYQFSLPPLILDAFLNEDALPLKDWLSKLESPPAGATYFNFTASHDGVGVRPLEGAVSERRLVSLVDRIKARGGLIGTRRKPDGSDSPYELNISYVDALGCDDRDLHVKRFLASQALMLSLQGMPALYFHSLVGTLNDYEGVKSSGINRRINRRKFTLEELDAQLANSSSIHAHVFAGMKRLIEIRIDQPAFHPDATQRYVECPDANVLCFERHAMDGVQSILVMMNFGNQVAMVDIPAGYIGTTDLLNPKRTVAARLELGPATVAWLSRRN